MGAIDITMLGTGSPLPDPDRAGPSTLVAAGDARFLVDCGRGVLMRTAAAGVAANQLTATLLTHLHSDHITDLNDVITTRWVTSFAPSPLRLIGPAGTVLVVDGIRGSLGPDVGYRLAHHEDLDWEPPVDVHEVSSGVVFDEAGVRIVAAPTDHRPVSPTVGYRFEHGGVSVVLAGDTVPCAGLDDLCAGADVLVITVIRKDLLRHIGIPRLVDVCDYHSSVEEAARTAARAGVKQLVLTHCVPPLRPGQEGEWRDLAAALFAGHVVVPSDLDVIEVQP